MPEMIFITVFRPEPFYLRITHCSILLSFPLFYDDLSSVKVLFKTRYEDLLETV